MRAPGDVGEGFVDGDPLDGRRELTQDSDGGLTEPLVFIEVSADKNDVGTELPRDVQACRFVRRRPALRSWPRERRRQATGFSRRRVSSSGSTDT
jgi:hypothetical protein